MTNSEKQVYQQMMTELSAAVAENEEQYDVSGPAAFCASVEKSALNAAAQAFRTWMIARSLTQAVRLAEGA